MSQQNNNIKKEKKQYKHLTYEQRIQLCTLKDELNEHGKPKYTITKLAEKLGVHKSTISRELRYRIKSKINPRTGKRTNKSYNAADAQNDYSFKRTFS